MKNSFQATRARKSDYNSGIDFLRIVAMFMIVITHVLGKGGIRSSVEGQTDPYYIVTWAIQVAAYSAVNCYALISGYVSVRSSYRYSKCLLLWLQVLFYTVGFTLIFTLLGFKVTSYDWLQAFFPVITGEYWYITAYFGLLIFMPLLNIALTKMTTRDLGYTVLVAIFFFSVMPALFNTKVDEFSLAKGFSMTWLVVLYIIGAYLRRLDLSLVFSRKILLLISLVSMVLTYFAKLIIGDIWYWYTSPTLLLTALAIFLFFAKSEIRADSLLFRLIGFLSPTTLGVYLFHLNPLMVDFLLRDGFDDFVKAPIWLFPFLILGAALLIYLLSTLVELVRLDLFKLLRVRDLASRLDHYFPLASYQEEN